MKKERVVRCQHCGRVGHYRKSCRWTPLAGMVAVVDATVAPIKPAAPSGPGWIYFVRMEFDGPIKIGYAKENVAARVRDLQVGNPSDLILIGAMVGGMAIEQQLHARFAHLHIRGEWFRARKDLTDFISANAKGAERDLHQSALARKPRGPKPKLIAAIDAELVAEPGFIVMRRVDEQGRLRGSYMKDTPSNREIARRVGCSHTLVNRRVARLGGRPQ